MVGWFWEEIRGREDGVERDEVDRDGDKGARGSECSGFDDVNLGFREWGFEEREGKHTKGRGI